MAIQVGRTKKGLTNRQTERQVGRTKKGQVNRQTDRQVGQTKKGQTNRQTDRSENSANFNIDLPSFDLLQSDVRVKYTEDLPTALLQS